MKGLAYVIVFLMAFAYILGGKGTRTGFAHIISIPVAEFLFDHKILIFLCVLLAMLIFGKFRRVRTWAAGFAILSLIMLAVWHKGLFRSLSKLSKMASKAATLSGTMRYKLVLAVLFVIAAHLTLSSSSKILVSIGMAILLFELIFHLALRFHSISRPMRLFSGLREQLAKLWNELRTNEAPKMLREWKSLDPTDPDYMKKRKEAIMGLWFFNRFFFRLGNYLGKTEGNRLLAGYFILSIAFTFVLTIAAFGLSYMALEKIAPGCFCGVGIATPGWSLYYSFAVITTSSFGEIIPSTGIARLAVSLEVACGILIAVILFFVFATVTLERYRTTLYELSKGLLRRAKEIKTVIEAEDGRPVEETVPELLASEDEARPGSLMHKFISIDEGELY
jgi:hypothetical protein